MELYYLHQSICCLLCYWMHASFQVPQKWKMWTASPTQEQPWGQVQWFWKERLGFPFSSLCGARTHARLCASVKSLFSVIVWSRSSGSKSVFLAESYVDCQIQTPHLLILADGFGIIAAVAQNLHQEIGQVGWCRRLVFFVNSSPSASGRQVIWSPYGQMLKYFYRNCIWWIMRILDH